MVGCRCSCNDFLIIKAVPKGCSFSCTFYFAKESGKLVTKISLMKLEGDLAKNY